MNTALLAAVVPTVGLLALDALLGIGLALKAGGVKSLSAQKLAGVAEKTVAPLLIGVGGTLVTSALSGGLQTGATAVVTAVCATLGVRALADVKDKALSLLGVAA